MGVRFDSTGQQFVFDFEHDGASDIVRLTGNGYHNMTIEIEELYALVEKEVKSVFEEDDTIL